MEDWELCYRRFYGRLQTSVTGDLMEDRDLMLREVLMKWVLLL
jgi:hypothetical protein